MSNDTAIKIVLRAAEAKANGHEKCLEIHEAVGRARELFSLVKRGRVGQTTDCAEPATLLISPP